MDANLKPSVKILATYILGDDFPAIIECQIGKGKAIMSGVHIEFDPSLFDCSDPYLKAIAPALRKNNDKRLLLFKHLLHRMALYTNANS